MSVNVSVSVRVNVSVSVRMRRRRWWDGGIYLIIIPPGIPHMSILLYGALGMILQGANHVEYILCTVSENTRVEVYATFGLDGTSYNH